MKILFPLLLLGVLGLLVAIPHIALGNDQGQHVGLHVLDDQNDNEGDNGIGHETLAEFQISLTGDQQFPPVSTAAFGFAELRLFQNGTSSAIEFRVIVCNIVDVIRSHIHAGPAGANGPVVIVFFEQPLNPFSSTPGCSTLAHGLRGPSDLIPNSAAGISNWDDFVHALISGNTYVNVHTTVHPAGEIRGQLVEENENEQGDD